MIPCRVVVGVTGASGAGIALRIVELLAGMKSVEIHLVLSQSARRTVLHEEGAQAMGRMFSLASVNHAVDDIGAAIASGSFPTAGMIVAPCSMRTLAAIATGLSDNLLTRRCAFERTSETCADDARDAAAYHPSAQHVHGDGGRCDRHAAGAGLL